MGSGQIKGIHDNGLHALAFKRDRTWGRNSSDLDHSGSGSGIHADCKMATGSVRSKRLILRNLKSAVPVSSCGEKMAPLLPIPADKETLHTSLWFPGDGRDVAPADAGDRARGDRRLPAEREMRARPGDVRAVRRDARRHNALCCRG